MLVDTVCMVVTMVDELVEPVAIIVVALVPTTKVKVLEPEIANGIS